ncbi:hypothetical protein GCM10022377_08470 [Zhihengliuella alba]|uniref:Uncharacterized protein n=1 Tax=Zhihengliuella alba TaxID=547018 RepID=A0ABP7D2K0_9MICC
MDQPVFFAILLGIGGVSFVSGVLAYRGKYVAWLALKSFFPGWPGLAGLYIGAAILSGAGAAVILQAMPEGNIVRALLGLLLIFTMIAGAIIGIIGMFWLPRFMLPQWVKDTIDEIKRGEDPLSQALRPGGSLYGRLGNPDAGPAPARRDDARPGQDSHPHEDRDDREGPR